MKSNYFHDIYSMLMQQEVWRRASQILLGRNIDGFIDVHTRETTEQTTNAYLLCFCNAISWTYGSRMRFFNMLTSIFLICSLSLSTLPSAIAFPVEPGISSSIF